MIGTGELLVILGVILVLFGGKKLPEFARNLGLGIREFKKACNGTEEKVDCETDCSLSCEDKKRTSCCHSKKEDEIPS